MNAKTWAPLGLAIVLGLFAAVMVNARMSKNHAVAAPTGNLVPVVVIKQGVQAGAELRAEDMSMGEVPAEGKPDLSFVNITDLVGRVTLMPLVKGQPVVDTLLAPKGTGAGLQALIKPGMRAITMDVNEVTSVAGLLVPGCRVDMLTTMHDDAADNTLSKTIARDVLVAAVGQQLSATPAPTTDANGAPVQPQQYRTVTLLVSPKDAELVELACNTSRPRLVLRNSRDGSKGDSEGITLAELRGKPKHDQSIRNVDMFMSTTRPADVKQVAMQSDSDVTQRVVNVIRGGTESKVTFEVRKMSSGLMTDTPQSDAVPAN